MTKEFVKISKEDLVRLAKYSKHRRLSKRILSEYTEPEPEPEEIIKSDYDTVLLTLTQNRGGRKITRRRCIRRSVPRTPNKPRFETMLKKAKKLIDEYEGPGSYGKGRKKFKITTRYTSEFTRPRRYVYGLEMEMQRAYAELLKKHLNKNGVIGIKIKEEKQFKK